MEANALSNEAGTGVLVRHLVDGLRARGHQVMLFTQPRSSAGSGTRSTPQRWLNGARQVFWTQAVFPLAAARQRVDVILCPAYVGPLWSSAPLVLMVLDLTFLLEPRTGDRLYMRYLQRLVPALVRRARRVVTISQSAAADIARRLPAASGKIDVAYPGPGEADSGPVDAAQEAGLRIPQDYLLMVGTLEPRKNYVRAIQAFAAFHKTHPDWRLLIAGGRGWASDDIFAEAGRQNLGEAVQFLGLVARPTLAALYRRAGLLFFPSLYEGFGFPILEAMAVGCPVVTSNRSSMAEVGDAAVQLVDPLDPASMTEGLLAVTDPARRDELVRHGRARVAEFSWERFGAALEHSLKAATRR